VRISTRLLIDLLNISGVQDFDKNSFELGKGDEGREEVIQGNGRIEGMLHDICSVPAKVK
jgi:hypothetical protein